MEITSPATISDYVRSRRLTLNLSQQELADRAGVSRQWLVGLEKDASTAGIDRVLRTIWALNCRVSLSDTDLGEAESLFPDWDGTP